MIKMYTTFDLAVDLKKMLLEGMSSASIGSWAYKMYWDSDFEKDEAIKDILYTMSIMEEEGFERSDKELHQIADDLFNGKEVKI